MTGVDVGQFSLTILGGDASFSALVLEGYEDNYRLRAEGFTGDGRAQLVYRPVGVVDLSGNELSTGARILMLVIRDGSPVEDYGFMVY